MTFKGTSVARLERARVPTHAMVSAPLVPSFTEIVGYELQSEEKHSCNTTVPAALNGIIQQGCPPLHIGTGGPGKITAQ
jgi:hypothetical protein